MSKRSMEPGVLKEADLKIIDTIVQARCMCVLENLMTVLDAAGVIKLVYGNPKKPKNITAWQILHRWSENVQESPADDADDAD